MSKASILHPAGWAPSGGGGISPDASDDFETYTNTANLISDPSNLYYEVESFHQGANPALGTIQLDTSIAYSGTKSMRYDWNARASSGEGTISQFVNLPGGNNQEVAFQANFRFPSGYIVSAYKFLFFHLQQELGRFALEFTNGRLDMYGPIDSWGPGEEFYIRDVGPGISALLDNQWHRVRFRARLGASKLMQCQIDDGDMHGAYGFTTAATHLSGVAIGKNTHYPSAAPAQSSWWDNWQLWVGAKNPFGWPES